MHLHTFASTVLAREKIFADMEELGIRPTVPVVKMVGNVFQKLGMLDKYQKLNKKYPPPKWEYRYIKGKRVKIRTKDLDTSHNHGVVNKSEEVDESEFDENSQDQADEVDEDCVEQLKELDECEPGEISTVPSETRESSVST
ncbi:Pentatricopeptide repeat-containing protein [Capsicum chinense]|nr:Pentatricopeptide repeat-containing protein [Capsicum chinense]